VAALQQRLDVPDAAIVLALVEELPDVRCADGRVERVDVAPRDDARIGALLDLLSTEPFAAPAADELDTMGVTRAELSRAVRESRLLRLADGIYVAADAPDRAATVLARLPDPFTVSEARQALGVSRRVAVPLLEHLDAARRTLRLPDGTRRLVRR